VLCHIPSLRAVQLLTLLDIDNTEEYKAWPGAHHLNIRKWANLDRLGVIIATLRAEATLPQETAAVCEHLLTARLLTAHL
jgi:hypothetical protein